MQTRSAIEAVAMTSGDDGFSSQSVAARSVVVFSSAFCHSSLRRHFSPHFLISRNVVERERLETAFVCLHLT